MRAHNSNYPQQQQQPTQQLFNNTDWSAAAPAAASSVSSPSSVSETSRLTAWQQPHSFADSTSLGSTGTSTNAGVRACAEAQTHTLRLAVADLESRAVAAAAQQPHQLQLAVERYLQQHLAPTLKQVIADMVIDEALGTTTGTAGQHSMQPQMQPHQLAAHALHPGSLGAPAAAHIQPFIPPRQPPAATVLSPMQTSPPPPPPALVDSSEVVRLRESLAALRDECAEAQTAVLQKDPSLSTPSACEARREELDALKATGTRLTTQQRGLESAIVLLRDVRAEVEQGEQRLAAAEQEQQREYEQRVLAHQQQYQQHQQQHQQYQQPFHAASAPSSSSAVDYSRKLGILARLGYPNAELNLALLKSHNGDIELTEQTLQTIAAQQHSSHSSAVSAPDVEMAHVSPAPAPASAPSYPAAYSPHHAKPEPFPAAYSPHHAKPEPFPAAYSPHHVQSGAPSAASAAAYPPHYVKAEAPPSRPASSASVSSYASGSSFASVSAPSPLPPLPQGHAAQSCAEALALEGGRSAVPGELLILYQCGFRAFDFSYRTSAVNHLKSLLRDKLSVGTEQLATGVWHHEPRYNEAGVQEWQSWVDCTVAAGPATGAGAGAGAGAGTHRICSARSNWNAVKTASTEEAAVMALRFMQRHADLKNLFLRLPPPITDLNPVSAVRNAIRDRSAWKGAAPPVLDEQLCIEQGKFHCLLLLGEKEIIGEGSAPDKVAAKTDASKNTLQRWNDAIDYIRRKTVAELRRYHWLELTQL